MQIPFHRSFTIQDDIEQVVDTLKSGWLTMGPKTIEFEEKFRQETSAKHAVALSSGTAAMHLALNAIGLKKNDEVIIPSMTFPATGEVVRYFNAIPVIVDVDKNTENILPHEIKKNISKKTKAIMPVHIGGLPCDMDEIMTIANKYNIKVIEDAAHCFPSFYKGKPIGTIGDITAFSFYVTKTIACGEGGMATTENDEYTEKMCIWRLHGINKDAWKRYTKEGNWFYEVVDVGFKYNMTDIQASLGLAQLQKSNLMWEKRKFIAKRFNEAFKNISQLIVPVEPADRQTSWHLYVLKLKLEALKINRNEFILKLKDAGISTSVHFIPLYRHPYYQINFPVDIKKMKNSEWLFERIISLPIFPGMTDEQVNYVIEKVIKIAKSNAR
jgi:dTDP-4-amino-4,6-dideoxygalactose transaminase